MPRLLVTALLIIVGCGQSQPNLEIQAAEFDRQAEIAQQQIDDYDRQMKEATSQMERQSKILDRTEAHLARQEKLLERYEKLADQLEGNFGSLSK
ncbi:MAG: hypothetical protein AAF488_07145 [Planctomycetota bacterium]